MTSCILSTCKGYARQVARPSCPPHGSCVSVLSTPPAASGEHMNRIRSTCTVSSYHLEDGRRPCSEPLPRIVDHHQRMGYREARPQWRFPGMGPPFLYPFASSTVVDNFWLGRWRHFAYRWCVGGGGFLRTRPRTSRTLVIRVGGVPALNENKHKVYETGSLHAHRSSVSYGATVCRTSCFSCISSGFGPSLLDC